MGPALQRLLIVQTNAKLRRMRRAFSRPRRWPLAWLAVFLACVWLSNMVLSILFREAAAPDQLRLWIPCGLFLYTSWHFIRVALTRPLDAIEWSAAERELVAAGPFAIHDVVRYRLTTIRYAVLLKATCFSLLMLPDLRHPLSGWLAMALVLAFVDLVRFTSEVFVHSLTRRAYAWYRLITLSLVAGLLGITAIIATMLPYSNHKLSILAAWDVMRHIVASVATIVASPAGTWVLGPFRAMAELLWLSPSESGWWWRLGATTAALVVLRWIALQLPASCARRKERQEREVYARLIAQATAIHASSSDESSSAVDGAQRAGQSTSGRRRLPSWGGIGPIVWRQWLGAYRQRSHLAVALALPGVLALLPVWVTSKGTDAAVQVAAALAFYTFLLLPAALKFDFRRDLTRMAVLKTYPIRPFVLALGQIITPAVLAGALQAVVLIATWALRPFPVSLGLAAWLLLMSLDVLIFAVDNLVYLLSPYRLNQEGIEIFLRTTLTFTAKGLIFTVGLLLAFAGSFLAHGLARHLPGIAHDPAFVFVVGGCLSLWGATIATLLLVARTFERFDPSQDVPA